MIAGPADGRRAHHLRDGQPAHAGRWAIDASKIKPEFGRVLRETFESGVRKTGRWQLDNPA